MRQHDVKPEIEVFDLSMLYQALRLADEGLLRKHCTCSSSGCEDAMPVIRQAFDFMVDEVTRLSPESTWVAAGIGRHQLEVNRWCLERGGHCRTGLEDNIRWDATRLARSNAELVKRVAICVRNMTAIRQALLRRARSWVWPPELALANSSEA